MGSESIAHSAFGLMGLMGHKGERNNPFFAAKKPALSLPWAITYSLVVAQPIRTQH